MDPVSVPAYEDTFPVIVHGAGVQKIVIKIGTPSFL